jgi:exosortase A
MNTTLAAPAVPTAPLWRIPQWRTALLALAALLALVLLAYRDTAASMVAIWIRSETFAHAFLVPPISLWLIWRQRAALARLTPRPEPWVLLPVAVLAFGWLLGELVAVNALTQFMLVGLIVLSVPAVLGREVTRQILFPLGFLFFAVPFGEFTQPKMMDWTADFTVWALQMTGVPVYREGLQFVIPTGRWSVVEACSGVRYLIASFMVGTLFAYLNYQTMWRRWVFVGISILVPIVANWLRAYGIVMMGHLSGNTVGVGVDHLIYGWVFFGVVVFIMFSIGARWQEPELPAPAPGLAAAAALRSAAEPAARKPWLVLAAMGALALLPHLSLSGLARLDSPLEPRLAAPDLSARGWTKVMAPAGLEPYFVNPSFSFDQTYEHPQHGRATLFIAYYRQQDYERKMVSSVHKLNGAAGSPWHRMGTGGQTLPLGSQAVEFASERYGPPVGTSTDSRRMLALQTYWLDGRWTSRSALAKLYGALQRLLGRGDDSAVVVVYAEGRQADELPRRLDLFWRDAGPALASSLSATRDQR